MPEVTVVGSVEQGPVEVQLGPTTPPVVLQAGEPVTIVVAPEPVPPSVQLQAGGRVGPMGPTGPQGDAATIAIGTVTTLAPGSEATVANVGTSGDAVFDFGLPQGATGAQGPGATIAIGTVTTGQPGGSASVTNVGTATDAIFDLTIPRGDVGPQGDAATITVGTVTTGAEGSEATVTNVGTAQDVVLDIAIPRGDTGAQGPQGNAATIAVGTVTTGEPGSQVAVSNSGTAQEAVFDITIPRGDVGAQGPAGASATVSVGTVSTGAAGSSASVTNSGTAQAAVFNFTIPRGDVGAQGPAGQGVPTGGSSGQILAKSSSADYATQWINAPAGSLAGLTDVQLGTPANNQALLYNSSSGKWVPGTVSTTASLAALTDVTGAGSATSGQSLIYDSAAGKWKPGIATIGSVEQNLGTNIRLNSPGTLPAGFTSLALGDSRIPTGWTPSGAHIWGNGSSGYGLSVYDASNPYYWIAQCTNAGAANAIWIEQNIQIPTGCYELKLVVWLQNRYSSGLTRLTFDVLLNGTVVYTLTSIPTSATFYEVVVNQSALASLYGQTVPLRLRVTNSVNADETLGVHPWALTYKTQLNADLNVLTDVDTATTTPTNGQALIYNSSTGLWRPGTVSTSTSLSSLTDVQVGTPTNGQALVYNSSTGKWTPSSSGLAATSTLLDSIASQFNGTATTFNLRSGGAAFTPTSAYALAVYLGGIQQIPTVDYTVSGSTITFTDVPAAGLPCFIIGTTYSAGGGSGGGATGGGSDRIFYENDQTVTADYTIGTNRNAMSAGPITIGTGVTVTIPNGSSWVII